MKFMKLFLILLIFSGIIPSSIPQLIDYNNFISKGIAKEKFEEGFKFENFGDKVNAANSYEISFRVSPSVDTAYKIGELLLVAGQGNLALTWFQQALLLNSSHIPSLLQFGIIKHYQKEEKISIECYHQIINMNRSHNEAWYNLGVSYQYQGEIEVF